MASLRIRNIDETTMSELRQRAESNKRSLEEEALQIIEAHLSYALKTDPAFRRAVRKDAKILRDKKRRSG
ncbi:MAG: FitA-like ribbon-helix-helix domain-containing protein [Candidatus Sulfotelmatobacter sp.]